MEINSERKNLKSTKRPDLPTDLSTLGKLPPQAVDLEEAVLGAIMIESEAVNEVIDILEPESFYKESNQKIYAAIKSLFAQAKPIDLLTVTDALKSNGDLDFVGGPYYISQLTNRVASAANVEYHARIVAQKHIQRELIRVSTSTIKDAYDERTDVFELLDRTEQNLFAVSEGNIKKNYESIDNLMRQALDKISEMNEKEGGVSGVETGFVNLDKVTSGFQPADMVVIAARPGMGKTAFVLSLARNTAVDFNKGVAIFSLEMSSIQLVNRLIASESGISSEKLKKGNLEDFEWQQLHSKIARLTEAPIYIDDTPALSVFELRAKCRRLKAQHDVQLIIIDYLQLMSTGGDGKGNREQEISIISRSIKSIAKELSVPILALSQLNRSVETRGGNKKPLLSDLRESGAIEQDADMVMFIYRPEYYNIDAFEDDSPSFGMAEIIIAKHRNGGLHDVRLRFIKELTKFDNPDSNDGFTLDAERNEDFLNEGQKITRLSRMDDIDEDDDPF